MIFAKVCSCRWLLNVEVGCMKMILKVGRKSLLSELGIRIAKVVTKVDFLRSLLSEMVIKPKIGHCS